MNLISLKPGKKTQQGLKCTILQVINYLLSENNILEFNCWFQNTILCQTEFYLAFFLCFQYKTFLENCIFVAGCYKKAPKCPILRFSATWRYSTFTLWVLENFYVWTIHGSHWSGLTNKKHLWQLSGRLLKTWEVLPCTTLQDEESLAGQKKNVKFEE